MKTSGLRTEPRPSSEISRDPLDGHHKGYGLPGRGQGGAPYVRTTMAPPGEPDGLQLLDEEIRQHWHTAGMSYDLAVWEGDMPANDEAAGEAYEALYQRYFESEEQPPTPRIRAYVDAVAARWPDLYGHDAELYPLSNGLIDEASGPMVYFTIPFARSDEVSSEAAQMAAEHGLVCYDPQWEHVRPAVGHDD